MKTQNLDEAKQAPANADQLSPNGLIEALNKIGAECPGCHSDLKAESDPTRRTGYSWYCDNTSCNCYIGSWIVREFELKAAQRRLTR